MRPSESGPAHPVAEDHAVAAELEWTQGMTLWDYIAAKALQGIAANPSHVAVDFNPEWEGYDGGIPEEYQQAAREAGLMADALLAERAKREVEDDDND